MIARVTRRPGKKRIVILGGGFAGVYTAVYLRKLFSSRELKEIEIVLVNRENYIVFQPLLPEIISGSVELNHLIAPIRRMAPKAQLLGRRSAVAEVFGMRLKGILAWLLWRGVYVTKFPGLDGQLRLLVDWILDAFLPRDITQLRLFHEENVHREHFEKGETIFSNGDTGDKVYFIVKGEVTVERDGTALAALRDGEVFGEAALLTKQPRNATLRAATTLDAVVVSREAFQELLGHLPGVRQAMQEITKTRTVLGDAVATKAFITKRAS